MAEETEDKKTERHSVPRVVEAITTVPWAITEEALDTIVAIAQRENEISPEALETMRARRVAGTNQLEIRNGVAIIRAKGPLFRYADFFSAISGAATYQSLAEDAQSAADNPDVRSIIAFWDSPGGEVNGCAELGETFRAIAARKPFESYVGGMCCSAAYWLASSTSKITIASTAMLGSIGVRLGIRDSSERDAKSGVKTIEFVSSNAPNKRTDWSSDEGRARIQRTADALEGVFLADVARYRGISVEEVIAKFGQGGVEIGQEAVQAGLADAIGSFESTISRLAAGNGRTVSGQTSTIRSVTTMTDITKADHDAAVATATKTGGDAAKTRISAILTSDAGKKRPKLANHLAFNTDTDATACVALMEAAAEEIQTTTTATAPAAPAAPATTTAPAATQQQGERSQDAAGGLALGTLTDDPNKGGDKKPAAINPSAIYGNRAKAMGQVA